MHQAPYSSSSSRFEDDGLRPPPKAYFQLYPQTMSSSEINFVKNSQEAFEELCWILYRKSWRKIGDFIMDKDEHASALGGSCDVFTAWSGFHNKKVAIKRIRAFMVEDKKFAKRWAMEICIWASLSHQHILPFLGFFFEGDRKLPNMVSEWMVNGSLHAYMTSFPRCSLKTCKMLHGIASGLAYLHLNGVVHADLKSQNVLIDEYETPLLADFGLSLLLDESQMLSTASVKGSLRWMAPELLKYENGNQSTRHTKMTDIWAFGMLAYELLSWKMPYFDKQGDQTVILAITHGDLPLRTFKAEAEECNDSRIFEWIWACCEACWRIIATTRPKTEQLERLWSLLSSRDVAEYLSEAPGRESVMGPLKLGDMETHNRITAAFSGAGIKLPRSLLIIPTNLSTPGPVTREFADFFERSEKRPSISRIGNFAGRNISREDEPCFPWSFQISNHTPSFASSFPAGGGFKPTFNHGPDAEESIRRNPTHENPMSVDRQSIQESMKGSPMSIDSQSIPKQLLGTPMSVDFAHRSSPLAISYKGSPMSIDVPNKTSKSKLR